VLSELDGGILNWWFWNAAPRRPAPSRDDVSDRRADDPDQAPDRGDEKSQARGVHEVPIGMPAVLAQAPSCPWCRERWDAKHHDCGAGKD